MKEEVLTDPQWLIDAVSAFITVLEMEEFPLDWNSENDFETLKAEGQLSLEQAKYVLEKSNCGVVEGSYKTIFRVLHLLDQ